LIPIVNNELLLESRGWNFIKIVPKPFYTSISTFVN